LLPPGHAIVLMVIWLFLFWQRRRGGISLIWCGLALRVFFSLPSIASRLIDGLQTYPALDRAMIANSDVQAIVILSVDRYFNAPEFGGHTAGEQTLVRLRYRAWLHRPTNLPVFLSGGSVKPKRRPLSRIMQSTVEEEFRVPVEAIETSSRNPWENAEMTADLLRERKIDWVLLVTHAWHMPRAVYAFELQGIRTTPAPTYFDTFGSDTSVIIVWLPNLTTARSRTVPARSTNI